MLTPDDLITLPFSADLTPAGIAYACRALPHTFDRMGGSPFDRLRRIVAGVAVELAFRRHLTAEGVPHDTHGATPFTDPDRYDLAIGGRRCDIKSFLIFHKPRIRQARQAPQKLLQAPALVPVDQWRSDHMGARDLFVFAYLTALITPRRTDLVRAQGVGQPTYLLHAMPNSWARPRRWLSLGPLALKSESADPLDLELGGLNADRNFQTEMVRLSPGERVQARADFHSLAYLHVDHLPDGRVGVHSPVLDETHLVPPGGWGNIWVYGMEIFLVGYITRAEFRRRAQRLAAGSRVFQYPRTRTENMALPMGSLRPLSDLYARARRWHKRG
jgi:hypothetical protein